MQYVTSAFLTVRTYASMGLLQQVGLSRNPYGHAAVRYTLPDGTQKIMNIVGFVCHPPFLLLLTAPLI